MSTDNFAQIFNSLGDKTRFRLFQLLAEQQEICVSQLAENLAITPACVSQHMKVLADAGLVIRERDGQRVCYKIADDSPTKQALSRLIFNNS